MLWMLAAIVAVVGCYLLLIRPHKYWIRRGVEQGSPGLIFGHSWGVVFRTQSFPEMVQMVYNISPKSRYYCGMYHFYIPTLVLRDPELIKQIAVKDFDNFVNHLPIIPENLDPLWSKNLLALNDQKWRDMRSTLSPAFTSSKMKYMFSLICESGEQFAHHFLKQNKDLITVEIKETVRRFTNDVIANTAFGVKCDSLEERNNEFYLMDRKTTDFTGVLQAFKFSALLLNCIFGITFFSEEVSSFFNKVVKENIASREKCGIVRPDMINLLLEARKHGLKLEESESIQDAGFATVEESEIGKNIKSGKTPITDEDIIAQALIFFLGGFDAVSSLMCFMSYELGINPDIQQRLIQEIDETRQNCNGKLTCEALTNMKYLDMVVSETLRMWPNNVATDRVCTKPYTIEPKIPEEKPLHLEKNTVVWLPIFAIQKDPQYFPEPNRFNPERFSDENKNNIKPYTYIPFGAGPRNCIGSRFALLETKILFCHILSHFEIVPVEKTEIPLRLSRKAFTTTAEGGLWFGFKRRVK